MVVVFPAIWWGWSPPLELIRFNDDPLGNLEQYIVPSLVLGMIMSGIIMRMTRTMMLEVLRQDSIRTAWSKGLKERVIILRHALPNAMIPVITVIGFLIPWVIGGTVITETIFGLPGLGHLLLMAIHDRDYAIVSGVTMFIAVFVMLSNLVIDLSYSFLDPRIRV
jgi:peptide/nickel transport system permease protein